MDSGRYNLKKERKREKIKVTWRLTWMVDWVGLPSDYSYDSGLLPTVKTYMEKSLNAIQNSHKDKQSQLILWMKLKMFPLSNHT